MTTYLMVIACVIGIAVGQVLFKACANAFTQAGGAISWPAILYLGSAMLLYGITSLVWVWILRSIELGRIYPFMALAFILVPLASHFMFSEQFHTSYYFGVLLIIAGVILTTQSA